MYPNFAVYQQRTNREIPLLQLSDRPSVPGLLILYPPAIALANYQGSVQLWGRMHKLKGFGGNVMTLTAYNRAPIPSFMYGTAWKEEATTELVQLAVTSGFRAIDTANQLIHYQEALVGEALQTVRKEGIERDALFLQTKFTSADGQDHRTPYDASADLTTQVRQSFDSSLTHLCTEYVDSYVLHGPHQRRGLGEADWEVWAAMEGLYQSGKTKMIGISNVTAGQLALLCEQANVKPMVVQNRCFAAVGWDKEVREICQAQGIIYQGFSLLTANRQCLLTRKFE